MDVDMDMGKIEVKVVVAMVIMVDTILGTMVVIVILRVEKTIQTIKSGIIQRHDLKRG